MNVLIHRGSGVPQLRVRPSRHRGQQSANGVAGHNHRLIENDQIPGQAAAGGLGSGLKHHPGARFLKLDGFLTMAAVRPIGLPRLGQQLLEPPHGLFGCLKLMGAVHNQLLAQQQRAGQLAGLENGAFTVLAGTHQANLEGSPLAWVVVAHLQCIA